MAKEKWWRVTLSLPPTYFSWKHIYLTISNTSKLLWIIRGPLRPYLAGTPCSRGWRPHSNHQVLQWSRISQPCVQWRPLSPHWNWAPEELPGLQEYQLLAPHGRCEFAAPQAGEQGRVAHFYKITAWEMEKSRSAKICSAQRTRKQVSFRKEGQEPQLSKGEK